MTIVHPTGQAQAPQRTTDLTPKHPDVDMTKAAFGAAEKGASSIITVSSITGAVGMSTHAGAGVAATFGSFIAIALGKAATAVLGVIAAVSPITVLHASFDLFERMASRCRKRFSN